MSGRHVQSGTGGRVRFWLAGLGIAFVALLIAAFAGPADASSKTVQAQLSLSGLASSDNPVGGSQIGVHPGDRVTFSAASAPTAGLAQLGLADLAGGLLNAGATFQVTADFSGLPGGRSNTVLSGSDTQTFTFARKGTYNFTWSAQQVTVVPILGTKKITAINLDGNQLAKAGVKLNASNEYVGKVVAATNPPSGGLSVQLPGVKVAPSAPVVGQLPTISIPGVNLPTVSIPVPDLNPGSGAAGSGSSGNSGTAGAGGGGAPTTAGPTYAPPGISVPQMVVGGLGNGSGSDSGSGGNGGFRLGVTGSDSSNQLAAGSAGSGTGANGESAGSGSQVQNGVGGTSKTVDLASSSSSPSGQLPVLLAILAVLTLAMVAGIYARLYLLGRKTQSSS